MATTHFEHFTYIGTPGAHLFYVLSDPYAPALDGASAQVFVGEWTGSDRGADIGVWEVDTGRWGVIPFDGFQITSHLFVDPYRPVIYLSAPEHLYEIDRKTLLPRIICSIPRQYTADTAQDGTLWLGLGRILQQVNPLTGQCITHPDVTPDEYFYPEGTHVVFGVGPDGRLWLTQGPIPCLAVYDPRARNTKVVWGQLEKPKEGIYKPGAGAPVAIGDLIWAGALFADAHTSELIDAPFPVTKIAGDDGYRLLMRGTWHRTPTAHLDRSGHALVQHRREVGWLEVKSGVFDPIGALPDDYAEPQWLGGSYSLHGEHTLISQDRCHLIRIDLQAKKQYIVPLDFQPVHAQSIFEWGIGPDGACYGSGYSHNLWKLDTQGLFTDFGDVVNVRGGELFGFARWKHNLYIISYTGSVLTRIDVTRPANNWGIKPENNPRHIIDLVQFSEGQHRPREVEVTPQGHVYYINCADYCTRREGAMVIVDAATDEVLKIVDPLVPGEQLFSMAVSQTRPEVYVGTSEGTFVVWDTERWTITRQVTFPPRNATDGEMTSAMIKRGGRRFLGCGGDRVMGNRFGDDFDLFTYHADTGEIDGPAPSPLGKTFGIWSWQARRSILLFNNGRLFECDPDGTTRLLYDEPLPGFAVREDPDGRLYISDGMTIFAEREPMIEKLGRR
ncbi:MAG: NHL repeat-containing protein [Armatimonadota bacterium]